MPFYAKSISKRGRLAYAVARAISQEPKAVAPKPLFDSRDNVKERSDARKNLRT